MWRVIAVAALVWIPLWPVLTVVLVELHDFPRSLHSFSMHERTGTHLTNKRCAHCGAAIGT